MKCKCSTRRTIRFPCIQIFVWRNGGDVLYKRLCGDCVRLLVHDRMQFGGYSPLFDAFIGSRKPFTRKKSVRNLAMHKSETSVGSFPLSSSYD